MSIKEIENRIIKEAETGASKINDTSEKNLQQIEKVHSRNKSELAAKIMRDATLKAEETKRSYLVPARLKAKKAILEEKQRILGQIYTDVQREKKLSNPEISKLREESEVLAAKILFG